MSSSPVTKQEDASTSGLLVLCKNPDALKNSIGFLNRRGVRTFAVSQINEAIERLSKKEAGFVLISTNFPHPKLERLSSLFQQTFHVECIGFSETPDRKAESKLTGMGCRHIIYGQASGPAILMRLRQVEKEARAVAEGQAAESSGAARSSEADDSGDFVISGRAGKDGDNVILKGGQKGEDTREAAARLLKALGEDVTELEQGSSSPERSGETFVAKGRAPTRFAEMQPGAGRGKGFGLLTRDPRAKASPFVSSPPSPRETRPNETPPSAMAPHHTDVLSSVSTASTEMSTTTPQSFGTPPGPPATAAMGAGQQASYKYNDPLPAHVNRDKKKSVLWKAARAALLDISQTNIVDEGGLSSLANLGLLTIRTTGFQGSFLLAVGAGKDFPFGTLSALYQCFVYYLRDMRFVFDEQECALIELDCNSIPAVLLTFGEFTLIGRSPLVDVGIALLGIVHKEPVLARAVPDHTTIKLADIAVGVPVTFEAFLHLPINQRVVRYLKVGSILNVGQKEKLMASGTENLLIKPDEERAFREFHARNALAALQSGDEIEKKKKKDG